MKLIQGFHSNRQMKASVKITQKLNPPTNQFWIGWMGLSETPLYRNLRLEGLSVGLFVRYRCEEPTETPCEYLFHTQGCYDETLVNISKPLIHFNRLTWPIGHRIAIEISSFVAV